MQEILAEALDQPRSEREEFLARACGGDVELRRELDSLLAVEERLGAFLEAPVSELLEPGAATTGAPPGSGAAPAAESLAEVIPDYELIRVCGEGAFGTVWIVRDRAGAYRAMKVIRFDRLADLGISQREREALGHYCRNVPQHSNLLAVLHIGQTSSVFYYTMELADDLGTGQPVRKKLPEPYAPMTLHGVLGRGRLHADTAVEITLRLLRGASCLHRARLIHRDIKPANIVFVDRQVKLADISLVTLAESRIRAAGTPRYMPPDRRMDESADTYALGKVLHEMISGRNAADFPHLPVDTNISSSRMDLSRLDAFLARACASEAGDRFADAEDMADALLQCRYPLHDSPLLELARQEESPAPALQELQRTLQASQPGAINGPGTAPEAEPPYRSTPSADSEGLWRALQLFLRMLPWIVVLILGYSLIYRLTQ